MVKAVKNQGRGTVLAWAIKKVLLVVNSRAWYGGHRISAGKRSKGQAITYSTGKREVIGNRDETSTQCETWKFLRIPTMNCSNKIK